MAFRRQYFPGASLALAAAIVLSVPARADSALEKLTPQFDDAPTAEARPVPDQAPAPAPLQGGVALEDKIENDKLEGDKIEADKPRGFTFTFGARKAMTSDDFRKLEYGILGIVAQKSWDSRFYTITQVLPDCPAALAGVLPGDVEVQVGDHVFARNDSQHTYWHSMAGKAGTPVDIVVLRDGKSIKFHLVRMNIEDIQNNRIRRMYEFTLSLLGPPKGEF